MGSRTADAIARMVLLGSIATAAPLMAQSQPAMNNGPNYSAPNSANGQNGALRQPNDQNWANQPQSMQGNLPATPGATIPNYPASQGNSGVRQPGLQQPGNLQSQMQPPGQMRTTNPSAAQGGANPGLVQIHAAPLTAPFALTPQQQAELDKLLAQWEAASNKVDLFSCSIVKLEYDSTFGGPDKLRTVSEGELKYKAPDKGLFRLTSAKDYVQDPKTNKWILTPVEPQEYWTCDGKSTFQVDHKQKLVVEDPIPPEMQGKSITEGPLPFVFGAKAQVLKQRYYMRITTPPSVANSQIWLEAFPKSQKDVANFAWVEIILTAETKLPVAIQIYSPGCDPKLDHQQQSRTMIRFDNPSVNSPWGQLNAMLNNFARPSPLGFQHVLRENVVPPPTNPQVINIGQPPQQSAASQIPSGDQAYRLRQPQR